MAFGIPFTRVTRTGRKLYFDGNGNFISPARFDLLSRRLAGGSKGFASRAALQRLGPLDALEKRLRHRFKGPPVGGTNWVSIAVEYPKKFGAFL